MGNGNLALKLTIQADGNALVLATQQGVRGLKEVGDQAGRTSVQIRGVGEANSKVTASFSDIGKGAVVFTAVASLASRAASAVAELPRAGVGFAAEIETAELGIAGVLTSMTEVNGQAVQFVQSQGIARTITRQLADDAARTAASTTELVGAFQALVGPGLAAGMSVQQIRELAVTGVSAVKALGLEQRQVVQELRDLVQGGITPASSTLATALGLKDADIAKARSSADGLFNFLTERLKGFEQASDAFATTFSGRLQALQEQATRSSAAALAPVIAEIGNQAAALTQALKDESGVRTLEALAAAAAQGVRTVGELVRLGLEYSGVLGTLATAYVGLKLGGVVASLAEKARVTGQASEASRLAAVTAAAEGQASAAVAQTTRQEIAAKIAGLQATVTATQGERTLAQAKVASLQSHAASIAQARVAAQVQLQEANTTQRAALAIGAQSSALAAARQAAVQRSAALRELASLGTAQAAVERQLTAAQVASQAAATNATTAVQRLSAAKGAAGVAAGAAAAAGRGFSAVVGALGGPVGLAITAVTLLIGKLVQMRAEAARAAGTNLSAERVRTALDNNQPVDDFDLGGLNTGINELKQLRDALELDFRKLRDQGLAATDAVALATVTAAGGIDTTASFASDQLQGHIDQLGQLDAEIQSKSALAKRAADAANAATSGIGLNAAQSGKALAGLLEDVKTATGLREKAKQQTDAITAATTREVAALRQRNASSAQIAAVEARSAEAVKAIQTKLNSDLKSLNEQGAADAKAIAEGRFAVTKAVAEQVAEIERNTLALFSKANEAAYAKGTLDATAYYTERARLQSADLDLQEKALTAELVAAQAAAESARKTEDMARAQARVVETTTKLIALGRERLQVDGPKEMATREWEAYAAAAEKRYAAAADGADALATELRNLQFEGTLIGQTVAQVQSLERARAEEMAVAIERQAVLFRDIDLSGQTSDALERQAGLIREIANQKAGNAAAQATADAWERTAQSIYDGLTDSLYRAFEGGRGFFSTFWDGIKNLFKTTVLKLSIQAVVGSVTNAVGLTSVANAATGGGGLGNLMNLGSNLSTAYSALTGSFITSIGSAATAAGNLFGSTAIAEFGLGLKGFQTFAALEGGVTGALGAGASTGTALSSAAAAGPYVLAAVAALNALGVFRSRKIVDGGLQGELGGQINDFALERKGGTLFSGPSYSVIDQGVSAQNQALQDTYNAMRKTVAGMAEQLGIGNDAIKAFTVQLGNDLIHPDTGGFGIKTQGLTQDEIVKKIEAALVSANEQLAAFALGTTEFTRDGETAVQTLAGLTGSLQTFNGTFKLLGLTLADASLAGADATRTFIESFGGAEQFAQVTSSFYQNFYTEAERTANTVEALRQRFFELGVAGATTREGFKEMVQEQQRLHGATAPVVVELLKLSDTFAGVVPAASSAADAVAEAARTFGLINTNSGLRAATEAEANAAADRRDLLAGRRAAAERTAVNAQELAAAASAAAAQAATDAANARADAERVLRQAYDSEIRALDEIVNARAAAVQALETAYNTERGVLEQRIGQFDGFAKSLRDFIAGLSATLEIPPQTTERLRARFQSTLNAALGGDASAISALPGVGNSYIGALGQSAQTELELRRGIAEIAISTQGAAESAEAQKSTAELQLESLNQQVAGLLEINASVLTVSEAITALEQASDAAAQAEAQKAILTAQVSSLITLNESVLSVRDAIFALDEATRSEQSARDIVAGAKNPIDLRSTQIDPYTVSRFEEMTQEQRDAAYAAMERQAAMSGPTPEDVFGAVLAQAGNFAVVQGLSRNPGDYQLVQVNEYGKLAGGSSSLDNEAVARLLVSSGVYQDRDQLTSVLNSLADQLDRTGIGYMPGQLYAGAGSDAGVDLRDLAAGGFGGSNFTVDLNAALKGPTGYGTLQQNQEVAQLLGISGANSELANNYRDLSFLVEGLGLGVGGVSPVTTDELAQYRIPGFASGGVHAGGWRMVGETGRELEYTPPSRIFSNSQTNALLDNSGVEKRLEQLEKTLMVGMATVANNTADTTRLLQIWNGDGLPETREGDGATTTVVIGA